MGFAFGLSGAVWAAIGASAAAVGTAVATYAAYAQSQSQQEAAKTEAGFRAQEAESARQSAAFEEQQQRRRMALLLGKQSALIGMTGVDPTQGSPLLMELDSVRQAELDAQNIRRTGEVSGFGSEMQARLARQRAASAGTQGGFAIAGGVLKESSILAQWGENATKRVKSTWGNYL